MLFAVKNRLVPTLAVLAVFVAGALAARQALGLDWRLEVGSEQLRDLLLGTGALAVSDGGLHGLFVVLLGGWYLPRYRALVEFFRRQGPAEIAAAGLLAAGEELVFRGVLLEGLRSRAGWPAAAAVAVSALVFGLLHAIPRRALWPFTFWAVWEGVLLGAVYVLGGSLSVNMALHFLHDVFGFSLFAYQRRTGWLLGADLRRIRDEPS
jgi:membrane protease YdiL (CAAX protease family)